MKASRRPGSAPLDRAARAELGALHHEIQAVVRRIPRGRVVTYGQVAELAGRPGAARLVGATMRNSAAALGLPWQRVVGMQGKGMAKIAILDPVGAGLQRALLEREGVRFTASGRIALAEFGWTLGRPAPGRSAARPRSKIRPRRG